MHRSYTHIRLALLTAAALALAAPALAQESDTDFSRTLRDLNADIDYGEIYREQSGEETAPGTDNSPAAGRTYADPGQTRGSAVEQDIDAVKSTGSGTSDQQLIDTVRDADRITQ